MNSPDATGAGCVFDATPLCSGGSVLIFHLTICSMMGILYQVGDSHAGASCMTPAQDIDQHAGKRSDNARS